MRKLTLLTFALYSVLCQSPKIERDSITESFNTFDANRDGKLTIAELRSKIKFQLVSGDKQSNKGDNSLLNSGSAE